MEPTAELSIIQKTYDLVKWYVPIIQRLPRNYKFTLGDRLVNRLYDLLEGLTTAKYAHQKLAQLQALNIHLEIIRQQTRLLLDFQLISLKRYEYVVKLITEIGVELGGWIKSQQKREPILERV
jgi:ABC-type transport system involved in cytochrome bd biosynthesis fused ATPase/permease subunit